MLAKIKIFALYTKFYLKKGICKSRIIFFHPLTNT